MQGLEVLENRREGVIVSGGSLVLQRVSRSMIRRLHVQGLEVLENRREGVIVSGGSLVLQRVSRSMTGGYMCTAANYIANHTSSVMHLNVKC